jgi:hypothetical protein
LNFSSKEISTKATRQFFALRTANNPHLLQLRPRFELYFNHRRGTKIFVPCGIFPVYPYLFWHFYINTIHKPKKTNVKYFFPPIILNKPLRILARNFQRQQIPCVKSLLDFRQSNFLLPIFFDLLSNPVFNIF